MPYSYKASDHHSAVDMHTLLCTVIWTCYICSELSCIASGIRMKSFQGNLWGSDSMTREWVL